MTRIPLCLLLSLGLLAACTPGEVIIPDDDSTAPADDDDSTPVADDDDSTPPIGDDDSTPTDDDDATDDDDDDTGSTDNDGDGFDTAPVDCDDNDASVHPGAAETCDGIDEDCDGSVDEGIDCDDETLSVSVDYPYSSDILTLSVQPIMAVSELGDWWLPAATSFNNDDVNFSIGGDFDGLLGVRLNVTVANDVDNDGDYDIYDWYCYGHYGSAQLESGVAIDITLGSNVWDESNLVTWSPGTASEIDRGCSALLWFTGPAPANGV